MIVRRPEAVGIAVGALALPFAVYFSVVVVGTLLGGVGYSVAGKPGALVASFDGGLASAAVVVFLAFSVGRALGRRFATR